MKFPIPDAALAQHTAVLGKTGSGKTSTEKLIVEHVVAKDFRVCVLDSIKSDWWGITSSADGTRPGLPFRILGGPRGHVPLHSSAGKVIGQLVGSGKLPLSIIDMADFEAGGLQRFFIDFAPALMRHARGVIYLVIEEAHEFAPKERSGIGAENMAIHWAKKLATAGRSKGIRLIVATQRIQALHNAVLGSCETLVAHRLSTPADQEPVVKWLKANTDKETLEKVSGSLSSLPTGTGWVCSGEAGIFDKVAFPKFKTYDNTATPTGDSVEVAVKTAPVDQDELRAIIGDAVKEAEANDPSALKREVARLNGEIRRLSVEKPLTARIGTGLAHNEAAALKDRERAFQAGVTQGRADAFPEGWAAAWPTAFTAGAKAQRILFDQVAKPELTAVPPAPRAPRGAITQNSGAQSTEVQSPRANIPARAIPGSASPRRPGAASANGHDDLTVPQRRIMTSLAFWRSIGHETPTREQVAAVAGYRPGSGNFNNLIGSLSTAAHTSVPAPGRLSLVTDYPELSPDEAKNKLWSVFDNPQKRLVQAALEAACDLARDELATNAGYSPGSGNFNNIAGSLTTMDVLQRAGSGRLVLSDWAREVLG